MGIEIKINPCKPRLSQLIVGKGQAVTPVGINKFIETLWSVIGTPLGRSREFNTSLEAKSKRRTVATAYVYQKETFIQTTSSENHEAI